MSGYGTRESRPQGTPPRWLRPVKVLGYAVGFVLIVFAWWIFYLMLNFHG